MDDYSIHSWIYMLGYGKKRQSVIHNKNGVDSRCSRTLSASMSMVQRFLCPCWPFLEVVAPVFVLRCPLPRLDLEGPASSSSVLLELSWSLYTIIVGWLSRSCWPLLLRPRRGAAISAIFSVASVSPRWRLKLAFPLPLPLPLPLPRLSSICLMNRGIVGQFWFRFNF